MEDFGDDLGDDLVRELMLCERRRRGDVAAAAAFGCTVCMMVKRSFNDILVECILLMDCILVVLIVLSYGWHQPETFK